MTTLLIFAVLLLLSGFFSGAETAFFSLSQAQIRSMVRRKMLHAEIVERLKRDPQSLLSTILIGNNIVNLFTASYATVVASSFFGSAALGIATGATTFFILVFGEIIPKSIAYAKNAPIACLAAWPLLLLRYLFYPVIVLLGYINRFFQRILRITSNTRVTEEEVRIAARLGVEHGSIDYREHEMIENVFRFDEVAAREIMTPLYRVTSLNGDVPVEQIAYFVSHDGHSRYPVYDGNEDNIIGYVHVNDLMKMLNSDERDKPLKECAQELHDVAETMSIERVFRLLKRERSHMCLVRVEKGEVIGIVTMEDVIEEIMGEIEDETDVIENSK